MLPWIYLKELQVAISTRELPHIGPLLRWRQKPIQDVDLTLEFQVLLRSDLQGVAKTAHPGLVKSNARSSAGVKARTRRGEESQITTPGYALPRVFCIRHMIRVQAAGVRPGCLRGLAQGSGGLTPRRRARHR